MTAEEAGEGVVVVDVLGVAEYELPGEQLDGDNVVVVDDECVVWPVTDLNAERQDADGRWRDHRQVINGSLWKLWTGAPRRDLPERYGPWKTCHERLRRWTADGTWDRILAAA